MRQVLIDAYLDYLNNYLTLALWAEHNGMHEHQAKIVIDLGRVLFVTEHPEN